MFAGGVLWGILLAHWPDEWADRVMKKIPRGVQRHEEYTKSE